MPSGVNRSASQPDMLAISLIFTAVRLLRETRTLAEGTHVP